MEKTRRRVIKYSFALVLLLFGVLLNHYNLGGNGFGVFGSVGAYFIYSGFLLLMVATLQEIIRKDRIIDERMQFVATKAMRLTFLCLIITAFIIMVIDGIRPIIIPYYLFMSYLVSGLLAVYYVSYKILLKRY